MKELEQKRYNWVGGKVKNPFSEENIKIDKPLARSIKKMKEKMQINVSYYKGYDDGRPRAVKNNRRALLPPPLCRGRRGGGAEEPVRDCLVTRVVPRGLTRRELLLQNNRGKLCAILRQRHLRRATSRRKNDVLKLTGKHWKPE